MEKKSIKTAQKFSEERFTKINVFEKENSTLFILNFLPGQQMPEHNHPERGLYLHVIEGNGKFLVDGEKIDVKKNDVIHIDPDEMLGFVNDGESNASIYVTMSKITQ